MNSFARVTFSEEDGGKLDYQFNTNMEKIYERIHEVLDNGIPVCGNNFAFLGFSQSSLKSQTAWFMSELFDTKRQTTFVASQIIDALGDFSSFRSPAKCAARIGQAFTDTSGSVLIQAGASVRIKDVENEHGRVFSDGCGTVSRQIANEVANNTPRLNMKAKPVVFQIRYQGKISTYLVIAKY